MRRLHELYAGPRKDWPEHGEQWFLIPGYRDYSGCHYSGSRTAPEIGGEAAENELPADCGRGLRANILAMGDVGGTLALAMKLTGADIISEIGICDINTTVLQRWERELNQIALPSDPAVFPLVRPISIEELFDCDVFIFCASRGVPDPSQTDVDVRMVQLEKNMELVKAYAAQAAEAGFDGEFFIVSDPVDPLCRGAMLGGIRPERIQGFGLGVMNGRAAYFARQAQAGEMADGTASASAGSGETDAAPGGRLQTEMARYLTEGRVFGPHGKDLVVANSVMHYDEEASLELTRLTVEANLRIRELGYKPYIAPAVTSGALSILENLRGNWHYSSTWFGERYEADRTREGRSARADLSGERAEADPSSVKGAFLGMRNRRCKDGLLVEDMPLDDRLFARIERAYRNLEVLR